MFGLLLLRKAFSSSGLENLRDHVEISKSGGLSSLDDTLDVEIVARLPSSLGMGLREPVLLGGVEIPRP
jgi:hypothetical protein